MLNLAEYIAATAALVALAHKAEEKISERIQADTSKKEAVRIAREEALFYGDGYDELLSDTANTTAANSVQHYNSQFGSTIDLDIEDSVADILALQAEKYFGLTLAQRVTVNKRRLARQINQTAAMDPELLGGLFTESFPFGAHVNVDRRVLLGMMTKVEQDSAKYVANKLDVPFVRWVLSHKHVEEDACDELATRVNDDVVKYLDEHDLDIDPAGLYFPDKLPHPPHPNCQCEYLLVSDEREQPQTPLHRVMETIRNLWQAIKGQ